MGHGLADRAPAHLEVAYHGRQARGLANVGHVVAHTPVLLLETGVPAKVVHEVLGHSTYRVTMDTDSHVTAPMLTAASKRVEGVLWR